MRIDYTKLTTLGALHMAQYLPAAFTGVALPAIFRAEGLPLEMFWLFALPAVPRWFKWLIALPVDSYGSSRFGYRKSWIVPCTLLGSLLYFSLSFVEPSSATVYLIVGILVIKSVIMAAQDVAVDAFATETFTIVDRTVGTSIIIFMGYLGGVIGGGLMSVVETFGWSSTMATASVMLVAAALPAILRREPPPRLASQQRRARGERPGLLGLLKRKDARYILPFMYLLGFSGTFFTILLSVFLVDRGLSLTEIGIILPLTTFLGIGGGALLTPLLVNRLGLRGAAVIGLITLPLEGVVFAWFASTAALPPVAAMIPILAVLNLTTSIYTFAANNSRFRWASKAQAATEFSLQSSIWNGGVWTAGTLAGFAAAWLGWTTFFVVA
jgi:MFS family permease